MNVIDLQKGAVYISARGKKFKFVKVFERLYKGFLMVEFILKPTDSYKHNVLTAEQAHFLNDPDLEGCCRFVSVENFFKSKADLMDHKIAAERERKLERFNKIN